jgi:hypothetical protein
MYTRLVALSGWLIVGVLLLSGAPQGWAQPTPPEGAFVRGPDGTVYAVSRGSRIRLAPSTDANLLNGLQDGPTAATVDELNAAIASLLPPPAISNPAETLIGQSARVCAGLGEPAFQAEVTGADWQKTVANRPATGNSMYVIIFLNMTNLSSAETAPYRGGSPSLALTDERGRRFDGDVGGALFGFQNDLAAANGLMTFITSIRPGVTDPRVIGFEVAPDVQRLTLVSPGQC